MRILFFILCFVSLSNRSFSQARLTIENNSMRNMTVKVMREDGGNGTLHETLSIGPNASETVYFSNSGNYFTKTKAVLKGKDPIYRKGQPFFVTNDMTGYSVLTLTFSITESSVPKASGGRAISKGEFDQN